MCYGYGQNKEYIKRYFQTEKGKDALKRARDKARNIGSVKMTATNKDECYIAVDCKYRGLKCGFYKLCERKDRGQYSCCR